ncbi:MAG: hypothetical protein HOW73_20380 [Polyangiaceae bacterium]|nr:hypothetical protein [Polyangiaceae bacterium]
MRIDQHPLSQVSDLDEADRRRLARVALTQSGTWPRADFAMAIPSQAEQARRRQRIELPLWLRIRRFLAWAFAKPEGGNRR